MREQSRAEDVETRKPNLPVYLGSAAIVTMALAAALLIGSGPANPSGGVTLQADFGGGEHSELPRLLRAEMLEPIQR